MGRTRRRLPRAEPCLHDALRAVEATGDFWRWRNGLDCSSGNPAVRRHSAVSMSTSKTSYDVEEELRRKSPSRWRNAFCLVLQPIPVPPQRLLRPNTPPAMLVKEMSDQELLEGIRLQSEPHFGELYNRYFQRIYNFVFARMRNHAETEEVVQETFLAVFRSFDNYRGQSSLLSWIYGIAKNTTNNSLRRAKSQSERIDLADDEDLMPRPSIANAAPDEQLDLSRFQDTLFESPGRPGGMADRDLRDAPLRKPLDSRDFRPHDTVERRRALEPLPGQADLLRSGDGFAFLFGFTSRHVFGSFVLDVPDAREDLPRSDARVGGERVRSGLAARGWGGSMKRTHEGVAGWPRNPVSAIDRADRWASDFAEFMDEGVRATPRVSIGPDRTPDPVFQERLRRRLWRMHLMARPPVSISIATDLRGARRSTAPENVSSQPVCPEGARLHGAAYRGLRLGDSRIGDSSEFRS